MSIWFQKELGEVLDALELAGIEYALVGGLAVALYGAPRATMDIDILIRPEDLDRVERALAPLGFTDKPRRGRLAAGIEVQRLGALIPFGAVKRMLYVDALLASEAVVGVLEARTTSRWRDRDVQVVTVEGLLELKQIAGRGRDLGDIEQLLSLHHQRDDDGD